MNSNKELMVNCTNVIGEGRTKQYVFLANNHKDKEYCRFRMFKDLSAVMPLRDGDAFTPTQLRTILFLIENKPDLLAHLINRYGRPNAKFSSIDAYTY